MALSQKSKILVSDITSALAGKQNALGFAPVKSVNGNTPDTNGNVTISATPTTVKGVLGSAWAANSTSITLPSGGTWFVWNTGSYESATGGILTFGTGTGTSTSSNFSAYGGNYSGGTKVYAKYHSENSNKYVEFGKLAAIRIA